jgi:hypothetical protein
MRRWLAGAACALAFCAPQALAAQDAVQLPSGLNVQLHEVIGQGTAELRLRYVSAGFDPLGEDPELLLADMTFLCESNGLAREAGAAGTSLVIVSIADRAAEFGVLNTEVRQSFEAFAIDGDTCIWEAF